MTRDEQLELLNVASSLVTMQVPHMGYRVPHGSEEVLQPVGMLRDGSDSSAVDMLSPMLRANFEDMLSDACHLLSMAFRRASMEPIEDEAVDPDEDGDEMKIGDEDA